MLDERYRNLLKDVANVIKQRDIITDPLRLLAYGTDASFYRLVPKVVIDVADESQVIAVLKSSWSHHIPVTFRAAGTSLSGQAVTDSVLVRLGQGWLDKRIYADNSRVALEPGIIGGDANRFLAGFGRKIGPDPASIDTAKIGGIVANNASGMCCGVAENSYQTLVSLRVILSDGTLLDTGDEASIRSFKTRHPEIIQGLAELRDIITSDPVLSQRIRDKFKIKNTTGYSINAFIDHEDPIDILQHLLVGSEGTLGFLSSVTLRTVIEHPFKATALILFPDIENACRATALLKQMPVAAVELMDRAALASVAAKPGMPHSLKELDANAAALLVETRAESLDICESNVETITRALESIPLLGPLDFKFNPDDYIPLWNIRKGLFPAVGSVRETGTTVIIEDVAFPMEHLADATLALQDLFKKHGYDEAIIFGHALEGNLHFVFTQDFNNPDEVERYSNFMDDVADLVVSRFDGSLKAEHGTGRNMAPFVEKEWGRQAYDIMLKVKKLLDPRNLLNPGVILNADPKAHLKHLKPLPPAHDLIDKCIECGFCEPVCPSRDITLSPRQRITSWREISRMKDKDGRNPALKKLINDYEYVGDATCATDGLCATRCPVGINTGSLIKGLRSEAVTPTGNKIADAVADHFDLTAAGVRKLLLGADLIRTLIGDRFLDGISKSLHQLPHRPVPRWNREMPRQAGRLPGGSSPEKVNGRVVYFPSCVSRTMGPSKDDAHLPDLPDITVQLAVKAGFQVLFPENLASLCCGQAFDSKGYKAQADRKARELEAALLNASNQGEIPVLCDTSPCLKRMKEVLDQRLKLLDPIEFTLKYLKPNLMFTRHERPIALHATCSTRNLGLETDLKRLGELCSKSIIVPEGIHCCGFAGDRGFTYPELNESALARLKAQVTGCLEGYSTSRTCEIGLSLHSGIPYRSILYLVHECTRPTGEIG